MGIERMPFGFQLLMQRFKVVNLAIEDNAQLAAGVLHGLMSSWGEINDGQTPVSEGDTFIRRPPLASTIGTAVMQSIPHSDDAVRFDTSPGSYDSCDATHYKVIPLRTFDLHRPYRHIIKLMSI